MIEIKHLKTILALKQQGPLANAANQLHQTQSHSLTSLVN